MKLFKISTPPSFVETDKRYDIEELKTIKETDKTITIEQGCGLYKYTHRLLKKQLPVIFKDGEIYTTDLKQGIISWNQVREDMIYERKAEIERIEKSIIPDNVIKEILKEQG